MRLALSKQKLSRISKIKQEKFLVLPLFYRGSMYWLESVLIKKNFNGVNYQITDVTRTKKI
ncbi:hypothetical protein SAMN04489761_2366 [Tenacibaculum sp. MAR_2009_124]|nr:hypothetical protein SAMN04489761_2366 [Tenacibaculum sp. MAR_2009_124]